MIGSCKTCRETLKSTISEEDWRKGVVVTQNNLKQILEKIEPILLFKMVSITTIDITELNSGDIIDLSDTKQNYCTIDNLFIDCKENEYYINSRCNPAEVDNIPISIWGESIIRIYDGKIIVTYDFGEDKNGLLKINRDVIRVID